MSEKEKRAINNLNFIVVTDIYDNEVSIDKTKIVNEYNESVGIVLNLVKTLILENKELKEKNNVLEIRANELNGIAEITERDYIPKSKIEEKIERIGDIASIGNDLDYMYAKGQYELCKELLGKE